MLEPRVVEYTPESSGVTLYVTPLSPYIFRAIRLRAEELYPEPDPEPYRLPIPNAAIPGDTMPADENPEYVRLVQQVGTKRKEYFNTAVLCMACEPVEGREKVIETYRGHLGKLEEFSTVSDEWQSVLLGFVIQDGNEIDYVGSIAAQTQPLTFLEVRSGFRVFRVRLPGETTGLVGGQASGV